ncbi:hypothetical protein B0H11DRAFT_2326553 [Mycena galericulata]|nr:hypothetical protein B0H11DRAFT_2326553 [Mycena galericulata]
MTYFFSLAVLITAPFLSSAAPLFRFNKGVAAAAGISATATVTVSPPPSASASPVVNFAGSAAVVSGAASVMPSSLVNYGAVSPDFVSQPPSAVASPVVNFAGSAAVVSGAASVNSGAVFPVVASQSSSASASPVVNFAGSAAVVSGADSVIPSGIVNPDTFVIPFAAPYYGPSVGSGVVQPRDLANFVSDAKHALDL